MATTVKELEARVVALEAQLDAALQALAVRVNEAHGRIDHAALLFKRMAAPLTPKRETPTTRVPIAEFNAALAELRGNNAQSLERFPRDVIVAKALERRTRAAEHA